MSTAKRAHGQIPSRRADSHEPSWSQGKDGRDASLGEKATAMGAHRFHQATGGRTASQVRLGHAPSWAQGSVGRVQRSTSKAADVAVFATVIDGKGRT